MLDTANHRRLSCRSRLLRPDGVEFRVIKLKSALGSSILVVPGSVVLGFSSVGGGGSSSGSFSFSAVVLAGE